LMLLSLLLLPLLLLLLLISPPLPPLLLQPPMSGGKQQWEACGVGSTTPDKCNGFKMFNQPSSTAVAVASLLFVAAVLGGSLWYLHGGYSLRSETDIAEAEIATADKVRSSRPDLPHASRIAMSWYGPLTQTIATRRAGARQRAELD